ncbi:hypothetical protein D3C76_225640 [compost metagenome]
MEKNTGQARKLFTRCLGSPIQMHREGVLELGVKDKRGLNSRAKKSLDEVEALLN